MSQKKVYVSELRNAIKLIKSTDSSVIRSGLRRGLDVLFYNNCESFTFGIDSSYRVQVCNEQIYTKSWLLSKLNEKLLFALSECKR